MGWDAMDDESNRDRLKPDSSGFKLAHKLRSMGKIADEFNRAVEREKAFLKNLDHDNDQHILSGGQGITNRRTMFTHRADEYLHAKDKEAFLDFLLSLSLQDINERLAELFQQIHEIINEYHEFLKLIDNAIENIQNDLQNITQRHRELNDAIQAEYFEKDEQGNFKSIAIQDTIAAFERRTGQKIQEDISPEELIQYLNVQRDFEADHVVPFLEEYQERLYEKRGIIQYEKDSLEDELDAIDHAIQAVDDNPNLTEEQRHQKKAEILCKNTG
jgi:hypothetical protein